MGGRQSLFIVWLKKRVITRVLGKVTPYELLSMLNLTSGGPEWGRPVRVHLSNFDGHAAEARWVGLDGDGTRTYHIHWQDKYRVSVEQNVRFTSKYRYL